MWLECGFQNNLVCSVMIDVVSAGPPGDDISPELDRLIRQRGRDLRLRKVDQQNAVKIVNHLIESLLEFLKNNEDQPFFRGVSVLTSGSYYEMVKVRNMNTDKNQLVVSNRKSLGWYQELIYNTVQKFGIF